jgi:hypothetical protein
VAAQGRLSSNWSGYAITAGPYTSAQGTFTVPSLSSSATCNEEMSEWVGIDGWSNQDLIQAGIGESLKDPAGAGCTTGTFYVWAWWEVLPAASTLVPLTVHAGDQVTVVISQLNGTNWQIVLTDATSHQSATEGVAYGGPGSSAEWVVEAPEDPGTCNPGYGAVCFLSPYSPSVPFSATASNGAVSDLYDVVMQQREQGGLVDVSTPGPVSSWPSSFAISYTGTGSNSRLMRPLRSAGTSVRVLSHPIYEG